MLGYRLLCLISYVIGGISGLSIGIFRYRLYQRAKLNVAQSGCFGEGCSGWRLHYAVLKTFFYTGVNVSDSLLLWCLPWSWCQHWVAEIEGWEEVQRAQRANTTRGLLFLTPHLGCFELAAAWISYQRALTSMYRPPKQAWLDRFMRWGRQQGQSTLVPAELKGVRALLKTLKQGGAVGLLPDQVPQRGEGVWSTFFGRPAYTMTLASRLQQSTEAMAFLVSTERRVGWGGMHLHFKRLPDIGASCLIEESVHALNHALEEVVRQYPTQYLWGYNRYKVPTGVEAPKEKIE
jgi:Kdo2-lipid IVA lauroyltransferase/acyltransferase